MNIPNDLKMKLKEKGFEIGEQINYGSYSEVHKAKYNNTIIAVKIIDLKKVTKDYIEKHLIHELETIRKVKHPNIITVHAIFETEAYDFIFMDIAFSDVLHELTEKGAITEKQSKIWFKQTLDALQCMHGHGIAHRDLKVDNMLLDKQFNIKLTDFGFSKKVFNKDDGRRETSKTYCGSDMYSAPQIVNDTPYDAMKADVWSFGVVLFTMLNNHFPFDETLNSTQLYAKQVNREWQHEPEVDAVISKQCKDIIDKMMEPDEKKRLTLSEVAKQPWIAGVRNPLIQSSDNKSDSDKSADSSVKSVRKM